MALITKAGEISVPYQAYSDFVNPIGFTVLKGLEKGEIPVGVVVVFENKIIARAHNQMELLRDRTAHAEMVALTQAAEYVSGW